MIFLSLFLIIIFFVLGIIHLNWVFGGDFGFDKSLPTKENGERVLNPKKMESAVVGIVLIVFGVFYGVKSELIVFQIDDQLLVYGAYIIPAIFILRAIGEFKYVGFFKRIKNTEFGKLDTRFFSPLCLTIGVIGLLVQILS